MSNIFPRWSNTVPIKTVIGLTLIGGAVSLGLLYYMTPAWARVGYTPIQPVPFDHSIHVDQIGMDCRYCHTFVDRSEHSNIPAAATCMNCHNQIKPASPALAPIRESSAGGKPVEWIRVHRTPDYVFFNHSVHVNRGVSCVECHGQINKMKVVGHKKSLSMGFCLDCHREPEKFLRDPKTTNIYDLDSKRAGENAGLELVKHMNINPPKSCSGCHR